MRTGYTILSFSVSLVSLSSLQGATFELRPTGADVFHFISSNEIFLPPGGARVGMDLYVSGWAPLMLRLYQAQVDSGSFTSGAGGTVVPYSPSCSNHAQCEALLGPHAICSAAYSAPPPPNVFNSNGCEVGFIDIDRPDFVFAGLNNINAFDVSMYDYRFGGTLFNIDDTLPDTGLSLYVATLEFIVSPDAQGTFTITFTQDMDQTFLGFPTPDYQIFALAPDVIPGKITIDLSAAPGGPIPTVSTWGGVMMTLVLLIGAKLSFARRRAAWACVSAR